MEEKKLVKKWYSVTISPFQDAAKQPRRELDIVAEFVYKTARSVNDERNIHIIWLSSPDLQEYNTWIFDQIFIGSAQREILSENAFIAEIMAMSDEIQPQDFERILQRLGFHQE
jgi:hypothetical protein